MATGVIDSYYPGEGIAHRAFRIEDVTGLAALSHLLLEYCVGTVMSISGGLDIYA